MFTAQWVLICGLLGLNTVLNIIVPISGSATVTPLLALLTDPYRAIGIASFFFFLTAPPRIYFFWRNIHWHEVRTLFLPSIIAAFFGALALVAIPARWLLIIILLFSVYFLLKKFRILPKSKTPSHLLDHFIGLLSGFLQGTGLAGSELRNQYLYAHDLNLAEVHGTTAVIAAGNFLVATLVRLYTGQVTFPDITILFYLFPVIILATWIGKKALFRIPKNISNFIVIGIMVVVVLLLAYKVFLT